MDVGQKVTEEVTTFTEHFALALLRQFQKQIQCDYETEIFRGAQYICILIIIYVTAPTQCRNYTLFI